MAKISSNIYVPDTNTADNELMCDVIGNKNDTHAGDSIFSHAHILDEHAHSAAKVYPTLADGVTVSGAAGAWTLENFYEIVPAGSIASAFDIHYIDVEAASASDVYEVVLYAATTEIARAKITFVDVANSQTLPSIPIITAIQPANTQIQAKCATSAGGADTIKISLAYHIY